MTFSPDLTYAQELDKRDELAPFRQRFVVDEPDLIYVDGNSLGRLPKESIGRLRDLIERQWGRELIRGWNQGWIDLPERVGAKMARLVGARPEEVIIADATSVNLYKLALAALKARPGRTRIVTDDLNFPSDLYILQGILAQAGPDYELVVVPSADGIHGPVEALAEAIDRRTALVTLSLTTFKSSYTYDMAAVTGLAHEAGALILWDTSHSVGSVPIALNEAGADLAIGCSYKYVNGGPGSPAFLYVRRELQDGLFNPLPGWMGQKNAFDFGLQYQPAPGIRRFLTGTPAVLSLAAIEVGADLLLEAGLDRLRRKSVGQTEYLVQLWQHELAPLGFRLKSPRQVERRGSHITLGHDDGWRIAQALIEEMNVLPDFRAPDNIRFGIAPLYNTYADIHAAVDRLRRVVTEERYLAYPTASKTVT
ncbi:MAG: kynureninase [Candidatus Promineifilaceae bacterium]|jgi:kynureninase